MNLLLDTHVVLWWLSDDSRLKSVIRDAIEDAENLVAVSAASVWEISIKKAIGKLDAPDNLLEEIRDSDFEPLPITVDHASAAGALPRHHDDPFDRMLIAQASLEDLTIVTHDRQLSAYRVTILEA